MMGGIYPTTVAFTGQLNDYFLKSSEAGKIPEEKELEIMIKKFRDERKRIQPIYNSRGKLIEYSDFERHLDFIF